MPLLLQADIDDIHDIAIRRRLFELRSVLFRPIDPRFQASLEISNWPEAQLRLDLDALNAATRPVGDDIPLLRWLSIAAGLVGAFPDEAARLQRYAARIVAQPEPNAAETEQVASATIATIQSLSRENYDVRMALAEARGAISEIAVRLARLVTRKRLHDVLHRLQIEGLPLIQASIVRERFDDPAQLPMIADHVGLIETAYNEAHGELDNLDTQWRDYRMEEKWIEQLGAIFETARVAVGNRAFEPAKSAVVDLRRLIKLTMSRLNWSLGFSLDDLDITALAKHLRNFAAALSPPPAEPTDPRAMQLRDAATRLLLLEADIERLVGAHDQWQRVDDDLWSAEDDLIIREETASNLESFSRLWPSISVSVQVLAGEPAAAWYPKAAVWASAFQQKCPMPATPPLPSGARDDFRYFMRATRNQFRLVDLELKSRCNRLAALTRPLQELAK